MSDLPCYTLVGDSGEGDPPTEQELRKTLENGKVNEKIDALKKVIIYTMQGERFPTLLMTIIRFVMPVDDKILKKLLLVYWEIVPKTNADGKLLSELILVCDAYRKDLQHPNEFVRGSTLRFLCKLKEAELLEPLMPAIQECLNHRHSYVRRNAIMAIYTIFKNHENLIPDAPELIQRLLENEPDPAVKRNAFMMLISVDQARALEYLVSCIDQVQTFNETLQLVIVELVHKVCRSDVNQRSRFIRVIYNLLNSSSGAVRYEAAKTLLTLSTSANAITTVASAYTDLILKESDNNIKLIVLDRLIELKNNPQHERVLQDMIMDFLRILAAPSLEVRRKTLDIVLDLASNRNTGDAVTFLVKELAKTNSPDEFEKTAEYRQLLVRTLHAIGVRFPAAAPNIVPQLMEFLSDSNSAAAMDVIIFVREAFERLVNLRSDMLSKLLESLPRIKTAKVLRATLWILGEYCLSQSDLVAAFETIKSLIGALPIVDQEIREAAGLAEIEGKAAEAPKVVTRTRITADGTYATESVYSTPVVPTRAEKPALRKLLLEGDFFLGAACACTLTKMALRFQELQGVSAETKTKVSNETLLIMASILHLGKSGLPTTAIDDDSLERIMVCIQVLAEPNEQATESFVHACHEQFLKMLEASNAQKDQLKLDEKAKAPQVQADDLILFRALRPVDDAAAVDEFELDLTKATGVAEEKKDSTVSKLSKVFQLSGFSDPVYAEAYVHVHQYDITLDVLVVNQTSDTLQSLTLELATLGDLKLTEKPSVHTVGPHDFCSIKANVKVSSTEQGIIFGNIVYDVSGAASDRNCVILNEIHIDIMDYIVPAYCTEAEFRSMWAEFEWENKVSVRTSIPTLRGYLDHLMANTNMRCLTPLSALDGECDFLAANLYARSVFGEDALANLSIEKLADGSVAGHIRIRSKTQGIALSLGDKITLNLKEGKAQPAQ